MNIGIDFGGVIVKPSEGEEFNSSDGLNIEVNGAIKSISDLGKENQIWIISKASKRVQYFTREWLSTVSFYQLTGFEPQNLVFCEKRSDKATICKRLNIDIFIDDSLEVIESLTGIVKTTILFDRNNSWDNVLNKIIS